MSVPAALACVFVLGALCIGEENWTAFRLAITAAALCGMAALLT